MMIKVDYNVIRTDGSGYADSVDWPPEPSLDQIRKLICPILRTEYIEHVTIFWTGKYLDMFVDENGIERRLPLNATATAMYRANTLLHQKIGRGQRPIKPESLPAIYGDVVWFKKKVWF